ncbi:SdpI family protein [Propionimicrobium sp. PCR01-08-3]|uniref:SdpI family protein n=1 Tax=Propionimicrobium sp. PCR01-08-3 TaxID=3052086 RepID=UPI00255CD852|nr:SdpI family protein [Propionimicrobium sp. PCR01-08-3]WIY83296.1 SdpI family protein [Propionimicrobium sp. PCR01-08-3]
MPGAATTLLLLGVIFLGIGILWWGARLRPNWVAGIQTEAVMSSKDAWYAAHRAIAWPMIVLGALQVVAGIVVLIFHGKVNWIDFAVSSRAVSLSYQIGMIAILIAITIYANQVARKVSKS